MPLEESGGHLNPHSTEIKHGKDEQIREKDKRKSCFLSIHFPCAVAQQTQCLSETLVETSALPVIWTLTKTTNIFFFLKL